MPRDLHTARFDFKGCDDDDDDGGGGDSMVIMYTDAMLMVEVVGHRSSWCVAR